MGARDKGRKESDKRGRRQSRVNAMGMANQDKGRGVPDMGRMDMGGYEKDMGCHIGGEMDTRGQPKGSRLVQRTCHAVEARCC